MRKDFTKDSYDSNFGYQINHTYGMSAENSTLDYPHYTANFMLYYFIRGTGNIKIEGRYYDISEGDIIILDPSELFHCTIDDNKYHERIVLHLNETILNNFPCDCASLFMPFYKREKGIGNRIASQTVKDFKLDATFKSMLEHARLTGSIGTTLTICKIIEILAQLNQILDTSPLAASERPSENPLIHSVLSFLNENFQEEFSITEIAEKFNINKSYLSHLFKEHVGTSLWNYIIFRRIYMFNNLIKKGQSIEETSRLVGFQNYSNFFRLYKKYMKMTPTEFKQKIKGNNTVVK